MLLDLQLLARILDLRPRGVLHVGAHAAEEAPLYARLGIEEVFWVEANPGLLEHLRARDLPAGHRVIEALVDESARSNVLFHVTTNSEASSMLALGTAGTDYPEIEVTQSRYLRSTTIDLLARTHDFSRVNMLNMDIQGAELRALRGAESLMTQLDIVYSEVNRQAVYEGCGMVWEIDELLHSHDLRRVVTRWTDAGWGDALYVRGGVGTSRRIAALAALGALRSWRFAERTDTARRVARMLGRGS